MPAKPVSRPMVPPRVRWLAWHLVPRKPAVDRILRKSSWRPFSYTSPGALTYGGQKAHEKGGHDGD